MTEPVISKPISAASPAPTKNAEPAKPVSQHEQNTTTYSTYDKERGHPFIAEHYGIERFWNEEVGGFEKEISAINTYLDSQIREGMSDTTVSVKAKLKDLEKLAGIDKNDRPTVKIPQLVALVEFLGKKSMIKQDAARYIRG